MQSRQQSRRNILIKRIKKKEVCKQQGKQGQARQPLESGESEQTFELLSLHGNTTKQHMVPTACKFQCSRMVARVDATAHLKEEDLKPDLEFPFTLLCQTRWSKNVMEEANAPDQILIG
jgi:hypothetical protein